MVCIGIIVSGHGVSGEVKVFPFSDFPERCHQLKEVTIRKEGAELKSLQVKRARIHGKYWRIKFENIETLDEAVTLKNTEVCIPEYERVVLPPGHYYYDQIIGLDVYSGENEYYGRITEVIPAGGQDVYAVENSHTGKSFLLPAVKAFIRQVEPVANKMTVELPAGLTEI